MKSPETPVYSGEWRSNPGGAVPRRKPNSIRRTSSLDIFWPNGRENPSHIIGRARDIYTDAAHTFQSLGEAAIEANAHITRELVNARTIPADARLDQLSGVRAGGQLRSKLRTLFPEPEERDSAQYLLLDDLAGATLVSSWGWFAWEGYSRELADRIHTHGIGGNQGDMRGVCIGFAAGSTSLNDSGHPHIEQQSSAIVPSLINSDDPDGWHSLPEIKGPHSRRARWIDLWIEGADLVIETGFQDSAARQDGLRQAIHEYRAEARVDIRSHRVVSLHATPHVLPHQECPAAVTNLQRLVGHEMALLRDLVPQILAKELGCTHLNDVLRALSATPFLAAQLAQLQGGNQ